MAISNRVLGKQRRWQRWWRARKRAMATRDEGGGRATARRAKATSMSVMAMVTGVVCNKEEARGRVMSKAMRVVGDKEGKGSKATATARRMVGKRWQQLNH
jgi:hypothetical protein